MSLLRAGAVIVSLLATRTVGRAGSEHFELSRPVVAHLLLLATVPVTLALALRLRRDRQVRVLGALATLADIAFYAGFQAAFHGIPGIGTAVVLVILIEGPVRYGLIGSLATAVPVCLITVIWPQLDTTRHRLGSTTAILIVLGITVLSTLAHRMVRRNSAAVRDAQERFEVAFQHTTAGIAVLDGDGVVTEVNPALLRLLGRPDGLPPGTRFTELAPEPTRTVVADAIGHVLSERAPGARLKIRLAGSDGDRWAFLSVARLGPADGRSRLLVQLEDITEREIIEHRLSAQARCDALTGLGNRLLLMDVVDHDLRGGSGLPSGLLFVDLDRFKQVNDALGHASGDELLIAVADRIRRLVRPADVVTRIGGDEFVVLCRALTAPDEAVFVARRIVEALREPVSVSRGEVISYASIGVALSDGGDTSADSLLADADTAMYRAKQAGGNRVEVFSLPMRQAVRRHHALETKLRQDLVAERLELHYQPMVDLRTGSFSGVEALLRWPGDADIDVGDAISVAEESDLIVQVGEWVLATALAGGPRWRAPAGAPAAAQLAINVSTRQLVRPGFIESVLSLLEATDTYPAQVCLEVTETALVENVEPVVAVLEELRGHGFRLAIDDFGTGHASLTYLARFPVDAVKVDRSFVAGLGNDPASEVIVRSVVAMAHALKMSVVAEGVETLTQLEILLDAGCDTAQGFLFARPLPRAACAEALANSVPWPVALADRRSGPDRGYPVPDIEPARRYRLLLDLARDVTARLDLNEVLTSTFVALRQLVAFTGGSIQLVRDGHIQLSAGDPEPDARAWAARIPLGSGVGGKIAASGEPRYIPDVLADPDVSPNVLRNSASGGVRSYYGVPLIAEGAVIGVLQIDSTRCEAFSEDDRFTVLAFTPIVAAAIQNARLFEREASSAFLTLPYADRPSARRVGRRVPTES
ncbi:MAG TPA: EAL domain-containing protein [Mycobacteriales bacterium]|nr:EAL domain-containing protein [Mycobacteriales bacterium]